MQVLLGLSLPAFARRGWVGHFLPGVGERASTWRAPSRDAFLAVLIAESHKWEK